VGNWLAINRPAQSEATLVHGDYRLGNVMYRVQAPPRIVAVLDWEMATLGDPLADLGYLTATWAETDDPADPMLDLSNLTRLPQFPGRDDLIDRYANSTGRDVTGLSWYQTLALWKAAIFLEGLYKRYLARATDDSYLARLHTGVPELARRAERQTEA
jgi:aminoglycoside phosphotransferase (APT) family kinase protein